MAKTAKIMLGGTEYLIHAFNIGELEEISLLFKGDADASAAFNVLRMALRRAEPKVDDANAIELDSIDEVNAASVIILELAGLKKTGENPPVGTAPGP
jgi:hypothetical protein